ncbi:MAG: TetR/AcrR family transcriptional regulator [Candidatus Eisenbacteria bacterium]
MNDNAPHEPGTRPISNTGLAGKAKGPATASAAPIPRWRRRKSARPGELLDAALAVFVERGYAATRLDDVARHAGVTKGTMYLYFENKEALFKGMVRDRVVGHIAATEQIVEAFEGSARDMFVLLMERWWARAVEGPMGGLAKLIMSEAGTFPDLARFYHGEVVTRSFKLFEHALRLGMARGEFRRVDPAMAVRLTVAPMMMAALWQHTFARCVEGAQVEPRRYFEAHVEMLLAGLSPNASGLEGRGRLG